jgi:hypothetical protein
MPYSAGNSRQPSKSGHDISEEWPSYFTGRREDIHALGVISLSYSAFERDLFTYAHHPGVKGMPTSWFEKYWSAQNKAS